MSEEKKGAKQEVDDERLTLLNAREAAAYLRVSLFTLSRIEGEGGIVPFRTPGGHRRYSLKMLDEYLAQSPEFWREKVEGRKREKPAGEKSHG